MNSLNSLLIEGVLPKDAEYDPKAKRATFEVEFSRWYAKDGEKSVEVGRAFVEVWNRTAETTAKSLVKGRGVRVVGRIKQVGEAHGELFPGATITPILIVVGETIELKPKFDKAVTHG